MPPICLPESDQSAESHSSVAVFQFCLFTCSCTLVLSTCLVWFASSSVPPDSVLRGPGAAVGAGDHGTGAARERAGHLSPGCHALPFGLFPRQDSRWVLKLDLKEPVGPKEIWMKHVYIYVSRNNFYYLCMNASGLVLKRVEAEVLCTLWQVKCRSVTHFVRSVFHSWLTDLISVF